MNLIEAEKWLRDGMPKETFGHPFPVPKVECRYCSEPLTDETVDKTHSYWQAMRFLSHKACKKDGEANEAIECQTIDADCNDCKFFQRGKMIAPGVFEGMCTKFDKPTKAYPKMGTGKPCFEHRKV